MKRMSLRRVRRNRRPSHGNTAETVQALSRKPDRRHRRRTRSPELLREQGFTDDEIAEGDTLYGLFAPFPMVGELEFGGVDEHDQPLHRIIIYKNPLEDDFPDPRDLRLEIRKTVIHELAHHFGYSERDLDPFESKEDPFGDEILTRSFGMPRRRRNAASALGGGLAVSSWRSARGQHLAAPGSPACSARRPSA